MRATPLLRTCVLASLALLAAAGLVHAQETVDVSTPVAVTFMVTDVLSTTSASGPATVALSNITVTAGHVVRVGLRADSAAFGRPGSRGATIAADKVHWSIAGATGGTGWSGQLSSSGFSTLFESTVAATTALVTLDFTLAAPGASVAAGDHLLYATWKFESIAP